VQPICSDTDRHGRAGEPNCGDAEYRAVIEYSNDILIVFPSQHPLYYLPAPFPDISIIIVVVVSVWAVLFT